MKYIYMIFLSFLLISNLSASEEETSLVFHDDWKKRDRAITEITKNFDLYKDNKKITDRIHQIFKLETELLRDGKITKAHGEQYGGYLRELLVLVTKLDANESFDSLLDWSGSGTIAQNSILSVIFAKGADEVRIFHKIKAKFDSKLKYYIRKRSGLLGVSCKYLQKAKIVNAKAKSIVKYMLINQLNDLKFYNRKIAIPCSKHFINDIEIMTKIKAIAERDTYFQIKKGKKIYRVRDAAKKVLALMKAK